MAGKVEWVYSLVDNASKNAKKIAESIDKVTKASNSVVPAMKKMEDKIANVRKYASDNFGGIASGIRSMSTYALVAAGSIVGLGTAFGVAVFKAQAFKETTMTSLSLMLKDGKAAKAVWEDAIYLADKTPLETQDVIGAMKNLIASGFDVKDSRFMLQALGDVASTHGEAANQALAAMITPLAQMKAFGKLDMGNLKQLTGWSSAAGLGVGQITGQLAKDLGVSVSQLEDMMQKGKVTADQGIASIMKAIQDGVSGGKVGSLMLAQSKTLTGLWSTLASKPFRFFAELETGGGIDFLREALFNITEVLSPTTKAGQKLMALIQDITNEIFGMFRAFSGSDGQAKFSAWLITAVNGVRALIVAIKNGLMSGMATFNAIAGKSSSAGMSFAESMEKIGMAIGFVGAMFLSLMGIIQRVSNFFDELKQTFLDIQLFLVDSFAGLASNIVKGFRIGLSGLTGDFGGWASGIVSIFKSVLGIRSPSKVFEGLGRNTMEGYNLGLESEALSPVIATPSMGGQVGAGQRAGGPSAGGRSMSVNIQLSVDARGGDGAEISRKIAELLPGELLAAFEAMAMEGGVA